jgi:hypothetical protein
LNLSDWITACGLPAPKNDLICAEDKVLPSCKADRTLLSLVVDVVI